MQTKQIKKIAMPAVTALAVASLLAPSSAFAAALNISQTSESGDNPASHIVVKEDNGQIVKEFDYAGGTTPIDPVEVEVGKSYVVSATANGYDFQSQGGTISQDANYPVKLVAVKSADVVIRFNIDGVTDYSGINVSLYSGTDTSGKAKATASTDASGKVTIQGVPRGDYTIKIDVPASLAGKNLPATQALSVPADGKPVEVVIAPANTDAAKAQADETAKAAEKTADVAKPNSIAGATGTTDSMSQTGDYVVDGLIAMSAIAVAGAGTVALKKSRKKN